MQRTTWMLVLGLLVGCNRGSTPTVVVDSPQVTTTSVSETSVPPEVEALFASGDLAQAIEALTSLIEKTPQDDNLYALRATANHRLGNHDLAMTDADQAIQLSNRDAKLYNNRGFMRLGMEQFPAALADFNKATELAPEYKNAFNNRGLLFIAQQKFAEAIVDFNRAIEIDKNYVDAYNNRGFAEFESGQIAKALDDFNIVISLNPEYVNAYNNRGLLRAREGDFENAMLDFTQAMILDPLNPKYYEHRRDVYLKQGEFRKAVEDEKKITWLIEYHELSAEIAATIHPVDLLIERAQLFIRVYDFEKALTDLDRAVALASDSAPARLARASVHLERKSLVEAKADADASLAIRPTEEAYSILGDIYLGQGDYDHAIENFVRAQRFDESVAEAYYGKSKELEKKGQIEQAKTNLDQALALDPDIESRLH